MKYIRYSRYSPDAADDIDLQELMNRLSDFFNVASRVFNL